MLALSSIPMFDRMDHPSVPTTFPWRSAAGGGQGWPKATAKRRPASLRATRRRATLATGGHSVRLPLPDAYRGRGKRKWEAHQKAGRRSHQLSCSCSFTIIGAMAERESSLISERVTAGMMAAQTRGKHLG